VESIDDIAYEEVVLSLSSVSVPASRCFDLSMANTEERFAPIDTKGIVEWFMTSVVEDTRWLTVFTAEKQSEECIDANEDQK